MKFEPGKIIEEFEVNGKKVVFRYPKKGDADGLCKYFNKIIKDKEFIRMQKSVTLESEKEWLDATLKQMNKWEKVYHKIGNSAFFCVLRASAFKMTQPRLPNRIGNLNHRFPFRNYRSSSNRSYVSS